MRGLSIPADFLNIQASDLGFLSNRYKSPDIENIKPKKLSENDPEDLFLKKSNSNRLSGLKITLNLLENQVDKFEIDFNNKQTKSDFDNKNLKLKWYSLEKEFEIKNTEKDLEKIKNENLLNEISLFEKEITKIYELDHICLYEINQLNSELLETQNNDINYLTQMKSFTDQVERTLEELDYMYIQDFELEQYEEELNKQLIFEAENLKNLINKNEKIQQTIFENNSSSSNLKIIMSQNKEYSSENNPIEEINKNEKLMLVSELRLLNESNLKMEINLQNSEIQLKETENIFVETRKQIRTAEKLINQNTLQIK